MAAMDDTMKDFWAARTPPERISEALWTAMKSIKIDTSRMSTVDANVESNTTLIASLRHEMALLQARCTRSEAIQSAPGRELEDIKTRSMRANIIVQFDPDVPE